MCKIKKNSNPQITFGILHSFLLILQRNNLSQNMHESDSIVIIPTYNEKENIEKIIRAVFGLEKCFHILVIDDGSPDGTAAIVKRLISDEFSDRLFILERSGKLGLGTAYIAGFKWALERDYGYVFEMDADFSHDPNDLPRLYAACATTRVTTFPLAAAMFLE